VVSFWTLFLFKKRGGNRSARSKTTQNHVSTTGPSIPGSEQAGAAVVSSLTDPLTGLVTDSTTLERIENPEENSAVASGSENWATGQSVLRVSWPVHGTPDSPSHETSP